MPYGAQKKETTAIREDKVGNNANSAIFVRL